MAEESRQRVRSTCGLSLESLFNSVREDLDCVVDLKAVRLGSVVTEGWWFCSSQAESVPDPLSACPPFPI